MWKHFVMWKTEKSKRNFKEINYKDIERENTILIDVRSKKEYSEGHLPGAINIPLFTIKKDIKGISQGNKKIVVYCQSGTRSKRAAKILDDLNYKKVYNLTGGIENI